MDQTRRRCEALVAGLPICAPFDPAVLCDLLGRRYARPIKLVPRPGLLDEGMSGLWVGLDDMNVIFFEPQTTELHRQHIICHELAHVLQRESGTRPANPSCIIPAAGAGAALTAARDGYEAEHEYEAELVATLILRRVTRCSTRSGPREEGPVARVQRSLGIEQW